MAWERTGRIFNKYFLYIKHELYTEVKHHVMKTKPDKSPLPSRMLTLNSPLLLAPWPLTCNGLLAQTGPWWEKNPVICNTLSCLLHLGDGFFPPKKLHLIFFPHSKKLFAKYCFLLKFTFNNSHSFTLHTPGTSGWPSQLLVPSEERAQQPHGLPHHGQVETVLQAI